MLSVTKSHKTVPKHLCLNKSCKVNSFRLYVCKSTLAFGSHLCVIGIFYDQYTCIRTDKFRGITWLIQLNTSSEGGLER